MKFLYWLPLLLTLSCATGTRPLNRQLIVEKKWVRNTAINTYLGPLKIHLMSPLVTEEQVVQGNAINGIATYERKSGNLQWKKTVEYGVSSGAVTENNQVYFGGSDGQFYCANILTGRINWTFPTNAETLSPPVLSEGKVYFLTSSNILYALDQKTGKSVWSLPRRERNPYSIRTASSPIISGRYIYIGFNDGTILAADKNNGNIKWEKQINNDPRFSDVDSRPVILNNELYVAAYDGKLYCLNLGNGKTNWTYNGGSHSSPLIHGNRIYLSTSDNHLVALDLKSGKELWKSPLDKGLGTEPVYHDGLILVGESNGALKIFESNSGDFLNQFVPGDGISAPPVADRKTGDVYFVSNHGFLYALNIRWGRDDTLWPWIKK